MDARVQFRINEETKRLAQQRAEGQGRTLSDACRELVEELAEQQRRALSHDDWLATQVNDAFARYEIGQSTFVDHDTARQRMAERKDRMRRRKP